MGLFEQLLLHLPMSFLQRRIVSTNYQALREIFRQRHDHKLREWRVFCLAVWLRVGHPAFFEFEGIGGDWAAGHMAESLEAFRGFVEFHDRLEARKKREENWRI